MHSKEELGDSDQEVIWRYKHPFVLTLYDLSQLTLKRLFLIYCEIAPFLDWQEQAKRGQIVGIFHCKLLYLRWHLRESPYRVLKRPCQQMDIFVFQHGLKDFIATDHVTHHFDFDGAHEADKHGAVSQSVQCARLGEQHLENFHEDFVVEQVDPEAAFDDFLVLFGLRCVKDTLKDELD